MCMQAGMANLYWGVELFPDISESPQTAHAQHWNVDRSLVEGCHEREGTKVRGHAGGRDGANPGEVFPSFMEGSTMVGA